MVAASNHPQVAGQRTRPRMTPPCSQSVSRTARDGDQLDSKEMVPDHSATVRMNSLIGTDDPLRSSQICCSRHPIVDLFCSKGSSVRAYSISKCCQTLA